MPLGPKHRKPAEQEPNKDDKAAADGHKPAKDPWMWSPDKKDS